MRFNCPNLYRREVTDGLVLRIPTSTGSKPRLELDNSSSTDFASPSILVGLSFRSQRLLDQLVEFGHRGGAKLETSDKERGLLDDGVIALGIACCVHDHTSRWKPHGRAASRRSPKVQKPIKHLKSAIGYGIMVHSKTSLIRPTLRPRPVWRELNRT